MPPTSGRALVAVATYNEIDNLPLLVAAIHANLPFVDILVVDDDSPDGTGQWCQQHAALEPRLKCLRRAGERGLGSATLAEGCEGPVAERTFRLAADHGVVVTLVGEPEIRRAMAWAYRELGQIVEPTGAVGLAGLPFAIEPAASGATVCVLTGGNVEPALLDAILAEPTPAG